MAYRRPSSSDEPLWRSLRLFILLCTLFSSLSAFLECRLDSHKSPWPAFSLCTIVSTVQSSLDAPCPFATNSTADSLQSFTIDFWSSLLESQTRFWHCSIGKTSSSTKQWRFVSKLVSSLIIARNFLHDKHCSISLEFAFAPNPFRVVSGTRAQTFQPEIRNYLALGFTPCKSCSDVFLHARHTTCLHTLQSLKRYSDLKVAGTWALANHGRVPFIIICRSHTRAFFSAEECTERRVSLNTPGLKIPHPLAVFHYTIQHNLHYHASELSLDPTSLTLQQLSCFTLRVHLEISHMTRHFIDQNSLFTSKRAVIESRWWAMSGTSRGQSRLSGFVSQTAGIRMFLHSLPLLPRHQPFQSSQSLDFSSWTVLNRSFSWGHSR